MNLSAIHYARLNHSAIQYKLLLRGPDVLVHHLLQAHVSAVKLLLLLLLHEVILIDDHVLLHLPRAALQAMLPKVVPPAH